MIRPRPMPPEHLVGGLGLFEPAPDVERWVRATFLEDDGTLYNEDHEHLQRAKLGFVWTNEPNEKRGRTILGTCQLMPPTGDKWTAGRTHMQISDWFDGMPDFVITLYAPLAAEMDDASFMALVEHELYHAAPKRDSFGQPMFSKETGEPLWSTRPHDVEQFVGVVRRYGARAAMVEAMVEAANAGPEIADATIAMACGNCL